MFQSRCDLLLALLGNPVGVELQFFAFEDVTVSPADLTWAGADAGEKTTLVELGDKGFGEWGLALKFLPALGDLVGDLLWLDPLGAADCAAVLALVPVLEWSSINADDGAPSEGVGPDELVVGRVIDSAEDSGLAGGVLRSPGEGAGFETEGAVLDAATADTDGSDTVLADTCVGGWTADGVVTLHTPGDGASAGLAPLEVSHPSDTHSSERLAKTVLTAPIVRGRGVADRII